VIVCHLYSVFIEYVHHHLLGIQVAWARLIIWATEFLIHVEFCAIIQFLRSNLFVTTWVLKSAPGWTFVTAAAGTSLEFLNLEDLLCLWGITSNRVIYLIYTTFVIKDFLHLFFRNKSPVVSESVLCQIFPTMVPDMTFIHSLFLFLPEFQNFDSFFFLRITRPNAFVWCASTLRAHGTHAICTFHGFIGTKRWHWAVSLKRLSIIVWTNHHLVKCFSLARSIDRNITQNWRLLIIIIDFVYFINRIHLTRVKLDWVYQIHNSVRRVSLAHLKLLSLHTLVQDILNLSSQILPLLEISLNWEVSIWRLGL